MKRNAKRRGREKLVDSETTWFSKNGRKRNGMNGTLFGEWKEEIVAHGGAHARTGTRANPYGSCRPTEKEKTKTLVLPRSPKHGVFFSFFFQIFSLFPTVFICLPLSGWSISMGPLYGRVYPMLVLSRWPDMQVVTQHLPFNLFFEPERRPHGLPKRGVYLWDPFGNSGKDVGGHVNWFSRQAD
jgi:hypothetical protein